MPEGSTLTTTSIDGVAVHTAGSGPALVLLHANGGDHRDFDAILPALAEHWTVHALDWPGHGESTSSAERGAVAFAELLPRILSQLPGEPFVVLGNSVGGFAAIRTAATHPALVRALVLVQTGGFTPRWPGTLLACRVIGSRRVAPRAMRVLPRLYLRRRNDGVRDVFERADAASRRPESVAAFAAVWRSFTDRRHDARPDAARIDVPTLLLWGRRDPVLPWRLDGRRARRAFPAATVATFRCGHQPFIEQPDELLAALAPFLSGLEDPS